MLRISGISKKYYQKNGYKDVLKDISLNILPGETVALMGANGSGKTTFLKILSTLIIPDAGEADIFGFDLCRNDVQVRKIIGYASDNEKGFYPFLTIIENLNFFAGIYGTDCLRTNELIDIFQLNNHLNTTLNHCSSGIKQRYCILKSVIHKPKLLLVDEPTKSLDPESKNSLMDFIASYTASGNICIVVTHDITEAKKLTGRILTLNNGGFAE